MQICVRLCDSERVANCPWNCEQTGKFTTRQPVAPCFEFNPCFSWQRDLGKICQKMLAHGCTSIQLLTVESRLRCLTIETRIAENSMMQGDTRLPRHARLLLSVFRVNVAHTVKRHCSFLLPLFSSISTILHIDTLFLRIHAHYAFTAQLQHTIR